MKNRMLLTLVLVCILSGSLLAQDLLVLVRPLGGKVWGYANQKGEMIIPATFERAYRFSSDGYAPIFDVKTKKFYFINVKGEKLTTDVQDFKLITLFGLDPEGFNSGMVAVRVGDKWGYMNKKGKLIVPAKYEHVNEFNGGYATAKSGGSFYVIDANGQETKIEGAGIESVNHFSENLAPFKSGDMIGYIDVHGKVVIPAKFQAAGFFVDRVAFAKSGDKFGYIDTKGEWVIKPQYQSAKDFEAESGLGRVKQGDKWAYVTMSGEVVNVNDTETWGDFSEGLCDGRKGEGKGFYNNKGAWAIQPTFEGVRDFKNGYAAAKKGGKWGLIDKTGNWVIQPMYEGIRDVEKTN